MDTSGKAFVDHWNWASDKGLMNQNTARGLRAAVSQVIKTLDDWEIVDVKTLNIDDTLIRFQNLRKKDFKPKVLETYKRRFRQAISSYLSYLEDPASWKPNTVERQPRGTSNGKKNETTKQAAMTVRDLPAAGLVDYPFPLREGQVVRLTLPRDLKVAEVKRLTAFMSTLAVDFEEAR